ncbi:monovalent cation/H(+) antiporter subunit G [Psychrobium sp. 1_MG-2023]|uniref:monovalent cation/H(+) antiporter subunit G n=1 Tax=Psychrobium sp. 1_MG-2023 TaxID=3062624 RepID=UPI000C339460|nr:monovalent cation/H(+) antiporter subunit G [Psychrobium sp. 1_MG-2023]MDP2560361.1 monovalent cation/H(+) antiporter subunit G [Psychrobium sp. 1_MG-2023]PKF55471.1 sodium:proton antiporter [Alteromonadales bacterium alter-6D02]
MIEIISSVFLIVGAFFSLTGAVGIFKFPDFFTRVHAASVTDSISTILIIFGLILRTDFDLVAVKLLFILIFMLLTSPTASHALAKSARHGGLLTLAETRSDKKVGDD